MSNEAIHRAFRCILHVRFYMHALYLSILQWVNYVQLYIYIYIHAHIYQYTHTHAHTHTHTPVYIYLIGSVCEFKHRNWTGSKIKCPSAWCSLRVPQVQFLSRRKKKIKFFWLAKKKLHLNNKIRTSIGKLAWG